jgi:AcrR family transcriptional regulator
VRQTRREIHREATIQEIKDVALAQMRELGRTEVRIADVAREMQMSAAGIYRYFDGRDGLLTALIADSFTDLAEAIERARDAVPGDDVGGRLLAVSSAFRAWGLAEPQRFALILGPPVPGYVPAEVGPAAEAAQRAMIALKSIAYEAHSAGVLGRPRITEVAEVPVSDLVGEGLAADEQPLPPATMQALMHAWSAMHGFISLEVYGQLHFCSAAYRDGLFASLVRLAADTVGLPAPHAGWPALVSAAGAIETPSGVASAAGRARTGSSPAPGR